MQGVQQAIDLIARVLVCPGDTVAIEDLDCLSTCTVLQALGARVVLVLVDAEGLAVDAPPKRAKLVYVMPSHQFSLGMPMSLVRRAQLLN